jgi:hypothetical protein
MLENQSAVINRLSYARKDTVGFSRFLANPKVQALSLIDQATAQVKYLCQGRHILAINDTTELNYQSHVNFLKKGDTDMGPVGNDKDVGFFLHPTLAIDTESSLAIGFSSIKVWNRKWDKIKKESRKYKMQTIEEKESYRWIESAQESKRHLEGASCITVIADRESDIYEEFIVVPDEKTNFLIRSRSDRKLYDQKESLYETLAGVQASGEYMLEVRKTAFRQKRQAIIEVRFIKVCIARPARSKKELPKCIWLYAVEAKEKCAPDGERPIHWRLLTTHQVEEYSQAKEVIGWYSMRWQIELLFSTVKSSGLDIEASEIETGKALKALAVISVQVALKITQLRQARNDTSGIPAGITFTEKEQIVISALVDEYEGKTEKQKNPYLKGTLAWGAWVIARLGGWKGYFSESPPGNKTMKAGLTKFEAIYQGFCLAKKLCA